MGLLHKLFQKEPPAVPACSVVLVAAGSSTRMGGIDKILCPLGNEPMLLHTLRPFQASELVHEIVVVTREDLILPIGTLCREQGMSKVRQVVKGGDSRTESVLAGIRATDPKTDLIAIHDGARPFITSEVLETAIQTAARTSAAAPAIPLKDTIKRAKDGVVLETPDRSELFAVQTPQVFEASLIRAALTKLAENGNTATDDCAAVERLGFPVHLTAGSEENIKITTPADLVYGEAILASRSGR